MYIKPLIYGAAVVAVTASLWMMVVQPRLDLAERRELEHKAEVDRLNIQLAHQREQIDDYLAENKRRQKIASELQEITQRIDASLATTISNIRRYAREAPDPNLLACFDMPVAEFHRRVRAADAATPAAAD